MCDLGTCDAEATHYVVTRSQAAPRARVLTYRTELCRPCLNLAQRLAEADLAKITEYGRLDKAWAVHPGGRL
jgi:hypothetical protein